MPEELRDIYNPAEYARQQMYQKDNSRFDLFSGGIFFVFFLIVLWQGWLGGLDALLRKYTSNDILLPLMFFEVIFILGWIENIPMDLYETFVIESKYGFNKTTPRTFVLDQLKTLGLLLILTGIILPILSIIYKYTDVWFWLLALIFTSVISLVIMFFYSEWIVPIFNKQTLLEEGELRSAIEAFARKADFPVQNIYVIDGSKRSTKSNAYFTGIGKKKRIVLYDTLLEDLNVEEIVAVLAHEIGHYKMKHVFYMITIVLAKMAIMFWVFSHFLNNIALVQSLGGTEPAFHLSLVGFSLLYSPLSSLLNLLSNYQSRKYEYQADVFAAKYGIGDALIAALKKISSKSLVNLTPHPLVVFCRYTHPTLLQRIDYIPKIMSCRVESGA
jgi:STE24 endopeptidase